MTISKYATQKITLHLDEIIAIKIFLAPLNEITTQKSHEFFFSLLLRRFTKQKPKSTGAE